MHIELASQTRQGLIQEVSRAHEGKRENRAQVARRIVKIQERGKGRTEMQMCICTTLLSLIFALPLPLLIRSYEPSDALGETRTDTRPQPIFSPTKATE